MKIVYIAPRYHTNQIPIVSHLISRGYNVEFLVYHKGIVEDYRTLTPHVIPSNHIFRFVYSLLFKNKTYERRENFIIRYFIPSISFLTRYFIKNKPNIVVLRGYGINSILCYFVCKLLRVNKIILYTQAPQYIHKNNKWGLIKYIYRKFLPPLEFTPVKVKDCLYKKNDLIKTNRNYIPFVIDFPLKLSNRRYLKNNKINILDVGKYRDYKNHFILLHAFKLLPQYLYKDFKVSIIGQVQTKDETLYFNKLISEVKNNNLEDIFIIRKNIPYAEMKALYLENDVFILTSKKELASISVLEAMSNALVCISTSYNGTATYIPTDYGFIFKTEDAQSLADVLLKLYNNKHRIEEIGQDTFNYAKSHFCPEEYEKKLLSL